MKICPKLQGTAIYSFVSTNIEDISSEGKEDLLKWAAVGMFGAGSDTVSLPLNSRSVLLRCCCCRETFSLYWTSSTAFSARPPCRFCGSWRAWPEFNCGGRSDCFPILLHGPPAAHFPTIIDALLIMKQTFKTVSAFTSFIFAMFFYPSVLNRAQAEVDAIVGSDRLPKLADRTSLPYIDALVKEVLRWNVAAPLGTCQPQSHVWR